MQSCDMVDRASKDLFGTLHDATLETVTFDWPTGVVEVRLRTASGYVVLRAVAVERLSCPRLNPWGPSSSVNEVRASANAAGGQVVELEMQSGDLITVEAASFTLKP
jgi:hypothetical protein